MPSMPSRRAAAPLLACALFALPVTLIACEPEEETCPDCCDDGCCDPGDCPPPILQSGTAIPWESLEGARGPAPAGTLLLSLTNAQPSCEAPFAHTCEEDAWRVELPLPPALQVPGTTVDLAELADLGGATVTQPGAGDCAGESSALAGTLEVLAVEAETVTVRIIDAEPALEGLEEQLVSVRCQNTVLPQQAVALSQSHFDSIYATRIAGEGDFAPPPPPEPLRIYIDVSDPSLGATCTDPLALMEGCATPRVTLEVVLDVDSQVPGTFNVGASSVTVSERANGTVAGEPIGEDQACETTNTPWNEGYVEIVAITPSVVQLRVTDAGGDVVDAIATRCY